MHGQEVWGIIERPDQAELFFNSAVHLVRHTLRITPDRSLPGQVLQVLLGCQARWHGFVGVFIGQFVERKRAALHDLLCPAQGRFETLEQPCHFLRRFQVPFGARLQSEAGVFDGAMLADTGHDILKRAALGRVIENIIDRNERHPARLHTKLGQPRDLLAVLPGKAVSRGEIKVPCPESLKTLQTGLEICIGRIWRHGNENLAVGFRDDIIQRDVTRAFLCPHLTL